MHAISTQNKYENREKNVNTLAFDFFMSRKQPFPVVCSATQLRLTSRRRNTHPFVHRYEKEM